MGNIFPTGWILARGAPVDGTVARETGSRRQETWRRSRILYAINGFEPGGAEHGLATLIENGFFDGHDLHVFAFAGGPGPVAERIAGALGADRITTATDEIQPTAWSFLKGAALLLARLVRDRPDAVVLSLKQTNLLGRVLLSLFPRVHCIAFEHIATYRAQRAERFYGPALRLLSGRVDEIWADTSETLDRVGRYYRPNPRRRHTVVPLFCAVPETPEKREYGRGDEVTIAAAGRLVARKRFDVLIEALVLLREAGIPARLDLYGDGPHAGHLLHLAQSSGLGRAVRFLGYRADWQAGAAGADMFVNPSEMEGFCIVVAEAMAVGLPVIATDVGGVRDYGEDGVNVATLPVDIDASALAAAIARLARDEELRRTLGTRARADIHAGFAPTALRASGRQALVGPGTRPGSAAGASARP